MLLLLALDASFLGRRAFEVTPGGGPAAAPAAAAGAAAGSRLGKLVDDDDAAPFPLLRMLPLLLKTGNSFLVVVAVGAFPFVIV